MISKRQSCAWSAALAALCLCAAPAAGQSLVGLDPVKVKTIPLGPREAAPVPPYPRTPTATAPLRSGLLDLPATRVKTLRLDRQGNVVDKDKGPNPP